MRAEPVLVTTELLTHATTGVNALRSSVPKEAGWIVPPAVTILSALDYSWIGRGLLDLQEVKSQPLLLLVGAAGQLVADLLPEQAAGDPVAEVVVRLLACGTDSRVLKDLIRFESLILRCAWRALSVGWNDASEDAEDLIERNGVELSAPLVTWFDTRVAVGDDLLAGGLRVAYPIKDPWATGTVPA